MILNSENLRLLTPTTKGMKPWQSKMNEIVKEEGVLGIDVDSRMEVERECKSMLDESWGMDTYLKLRELKLPPRFTVDE